MSARQSKHWIILKKSFFSIHVFKSLFLSARNRKSDTAFEDTEKNNDAINDDSNNIIKINETTEWIEKQRVIKPKKPKNPNVMHLKNGVSIIRVGSKNNPMVKKRGFIPLGGKKINKKFDDIFSGNFACALIIHLDLVYLVTSWGSSNNHSSFL